MKSCKEAVYWFGFSFAFSVMALGAFLLVVAGVVGFVLYLTAPLEVAGPVFSLLLTLSILTPFYTFLEHFYGPS